MGLDVDSFGEINLEDRIHAEDKTRFESFKRGEEKTIAARLQDLSGQWHPFNWKVRTLKNCEAIAATGTLLGFFDHVTSIRQDLVKCWSQLRIQCNPAGISRHDRVVIDAGFLDMLP